MVNRKYTVDERIESVVQHLPTKGSLRWTSRELRTVDDTLIQGWSERLRIAEAEIRRMRGQLEGVASGRSCGYCGNKIGGRADRKYCSDACRQMGYRSRLEP